MCHVYIYLIVNNIDSSFVFLFSFCSHIYVVCVLFTEPYTVREARIHVRHVRDLMKSVDQADAYNGVDCSSLSALNTITLGDILGKVRL